MSVINIYHLKLFYILPLKRWANNNESNLTLIVLQHNKAGSSHLADSSSKTVQRNGKEYDAKRNQYYELRPNHAKTSTASIPNCGIERTSPVCHLNAGFYGSLNASKPSKHSKITTESSLWHL